MLQLCLALLEKHLQLASKRNVSQHEEKNSLLKWKYGAHQHEYIIQNMHEFICYCVFLSFAWRCLIFSSFSSSNFNNLFFLVQMWKMKPEHIYK